jgi:hypothetical protein
MHPSQSTPMRPHGTSGIRLPKQKDGTIFGRAKAFLSKTQGAVYTLTGLLAVMILAVHCIDNVVGWVMSMVGQMVFILCSCFVLMTFQDYEDSMGYEASDIERLINPIMLSESLIRGVQIVEFIHLNSYFLLLCSACILGYDRLVRQPQHVDATRLWKDIGPLKYDVKVKVGVNVVFFFIVMAVMIYKVLQELD